MRSYFHLFQGPRHLPNSTSSYPTDPSTLLHSQHCRLPAGLNSESRPIFKGQNQEIETFRMYMLLCLTIVEGAGRGCMQRDRFIL